MAVETLEPNVERTGFINYRRECGPDEAENSDFLAHIRRHMRLQVGEAIVQRLADGRQYVVRLWEGMEMALRGREWFSISDFETKERVDTEVPFYEKPFRPHRAHMWMTGLIVLRDYRDAEVGEYVAHSVIAKGGEFYYQAEQDPSRLDWIEEPRRFHLVEFRLPGQEIARVMQRGR